MTVRSSKRTIRKDVYFAQIPEWVLFHEDLKPLDIRLYAVLERYSEGSAFPGRKLLATKLGVSSVRTIDASLDRLEDAGAVTVIERWDDAGDRTSNLYEVHMIPNQGVEHEVAPPPAADCTTGGATECTTGGAADCSLERATFSTTPLPPNTGEPDPVDDITAAAPPALAAVRDDCPKHGAEPAANCRGCGTTVRQVQITRRQTEALQRRDESLAIAAAERRAREATRPPPEHTSSRVQQVKAQIVRSNT